ncbi:hypothetical protein KC622_01065, partial [Candidatus Dojkabacteria bacterium]|nr:hypothetical protein [Candidatus Dojkabacteria bacterium]
MAKRKIKAKHIIKDFKEKFSIGIKVFRHALKTTPFDFLIGFFALIATILIPIGSRYYEKNVIDEVIRLLQTSPEARVLTPLISFVIISSVLRLSQGLAWSINNVTEKRVFYKVQEALTFEFLRKSVSLDIEHFEDPRKSNLIEQAEAAYHDKGSNMAIRVLWLLRNFIGILSAVTIIAFFSP